MIDILAQLQHMILSAVKQSWVSAWGTESNALGPLFTS